MDSSVFTLTQEQKQRIHDKLEPFRFTPSCLKEKKQVQVQGVSTPGNKQECKDLITFLNLSKVMHIPSGIYTYNTCLVSIFRTNKYTKSCNSSFDIIPQRKKEQILENVFNQVFPDMFLYNKLIHPNFQTKQTNLKRPDWQFNTENYLICIECDENQHKSIHPLAEMHRMYSIYSEMKLNQINKQCIFIRFNPDSFRKGKKKYQCPFVKDEETKKLFPSVYLRQKINTLIDRIQFNMKREVENASIIIEYLFYDTVI